MTRTILGQFAEPTAAQRARTELVAVGLTRTSTYREDIGEQELDGCQLVLVEADGREAEARDPAARGRGGPGGPPGRRRHARGRALREIVFGLNDGLVTTLGVVMADPTRAADPAGLHGMGLRIALDDFGTGYSSLAYLKKLPVDEIKIDKSFVRDMSVNADDATIARSVIDKGHNRGMRGTATAGRRGPRDHDAVQGGLGDLHGVAVGGTAGYAQRHPAPVGQHVAFGAQLAAIGRIGPGVCPAEGGRYRRAVGGLPVPADAVLRVIAPQLVRPQPCPDPAGHPLLKPAVTGRARPKLLGHRFPLAARAQHMQDAIEHPPPGHRRTTRRPRCFLRRQQRAALRP